MILYEFKPVFRLRMFDMFLRRITSAVNLILKIQNKVKYSLFLFLQKISKILFYTSEKSVTIKGDSVEETLF